MEAEECVKLTRSSCSGSASLSICVATFLDEAVMFDDDLVMGGRR